MTFDAFFREKYPQLHDDIDTLETNPTFLTRQDLQEAYSTGAVSRSDEISKLSAHIEGLQLALQDKFTLNQTHKTFSLWGKK